MYSSVSAVVLGKYMRFTAAIIACAAFAMSSLFSQQSGDEKLIQFDKVLAEANEVVNQLSPQGPLQSLINASQSINEKKIKECSGAHSEIDIYKKNITENQRKTEALKALCKKAKEYRQEIVELRSQYLIITRSGDSTAVNSCLDKLLDLQNRLVGFLNSAGSELCK